MNLTTILHEIFVAKQAGTIYHYTGISGALGILEDAYIQSSEAVKTCLHNAVDTTVTLILIDLEKVYFIDSAGLSALVSGLRVARENNKDIILAGLNKQAEMVFKLTMLDRIFVIHASVESALADIPK